MAEDTLGRGEVLNLTANIVSAHVANNDVAGAEVATLIQSVYSKLAELASTEEVQPVDLTPAVPIRRSVTDDYIVCLDCGTKQKMLKRHLMTAHDMSPQAYRTKWGLKADYPMVAPNYSAQRQELAKKIGLGRKRSEPEPEPQAVTKVRRTAKKAAPEPEPQAPTKGRRTRKNAA